MNTRASQNCDLVEIAQKSGWKTVSDEIGEYDYQHYIDYLVINSREHICDLIDAATRFEDRAKRAESQRDELLAAAQAAHAALSQPVQFTHSLDGAPILRGDAQTARGLLMEAISKAESQG